MIFNIVEYSKDFDKQLLELFYKSVFNNRREFDYARIPNWNDRYRIGKNNIKKIALSNENEIIASLGMLTYEGYVRNKRKNIGFIVDNCVLPKYECFHEEIMSSLFRNIEKEGKKLGIDYILFWDYKINADLYNELYTSLGYYRVDNVNWIGGGTYPIKIFSFGNFNISIFWKIIFKILNLKNTLYELFLPSLKNVKIRAMMNKDIKEVVNLLNNKNKNLDFSVKYTEQMLKEKIKRYNAKTIILEENNKIVGCLIYFYSPWTGWMYGKPIYNKNYGIFLINTILEIAIDDPSRKNQAANLIFKSMKNGKQKYIMIVDVFDLKQNDYKDILLKTGAKEYSFDFGSLFIKSLNKEKISLNNPVYVPSNFIIGPYNLNFAPRSKFCFFF